jgi:alpha-tubulin suppressor-like RCC1 family protein
MIEAPKPNDDDDEETKKIAAADHDKEMKIYSVCNISKVDFPFLKSDIINYISCGTNHIFVRTNLDEIYGWGKNDEG